MPALPLPSPANLLRRLPFGRPANNGGDGQIFAAKPGRNRGRRGWLRSLSPAQTLVLSFVVLIAAGTLLLRYLPGIYADPAEGLDLLDSLFTATSAVCVTGLIVVDTATYFNFWGQLLILGMIQLGGLGMIGLASAIIVTLNRRLSLRQHAIAGGGEATGPAANVPVRGLVRDVLVFTLASEGIVFLLLWALWASQPADTLPELNGHPLVWHALFHSVSAFCNAGFSTFSDSLVGFQDRAATQLVVMGGVVLGGIGFLTLEELKLWVQGRSGERAFRLSLHTRLVLAATLVAVLSGWALLGALEWSNPKTLGRLDWGDKLVNALFLSVTPRTAGFNTIDYDAALPATNFLTILLMSIGGAPGGTAGGMKVTTVAILIAMAHARFRGHRTTDLWGRTVPTPTAQRAVGLFTFAFTIVTIGILLLSVTELGLGPTVAEELHMSGAGKFEFLDYMFEASSAFNTVGLSTGPSFTGALSPSGRFLIVLLMFVGRVGPLTFAAALSRGSPEQRLVRRYAQEDVVVG